jgi:hypothetical protein
MGAVAESLFPDDDLKALYDDTVGELGLVDP